MVGSWVQTVVQAWLVYRLTDSATWLGLITAAQQLPAFCLSPLAGVIADRVERRKLLVIVESVQMLQAFLLAALVYSGHIQVWHVAALAAVLGVASSFELTTRHAFASDMVPKEDLPSAIALNTVILNSARVIGPAIGAALIGIIGEATCFLLNGISYLAVIYGLVRMRLNPRAMRHAHPKPLFEEILEAVEVVRGNPPIIRLLIMITAVAMLGFPYQTLLPVIANSLGGTAHAYTFLTTMSGVGAVLGALVFGLNRAAPFLHPQPAHPPHFANQGVERRILIEISIAALAVMSLSFARTIYQAGAGCFLAGASLMAVFPKVNAAIQDAARDEMRARIMSLYSMTFLGAFPIGSYLIGVITDHAGYRFALLACGAVSLGFAVAWLPLMRATRCFWERPATRMSA